MKVVETGGGRARSGKPRGDGGTGRGHNGNAIHKASSVVMPPPCGKVSSAMSTWLVSSIATSSPKQKIPPSTGHVLDDCAGAGSGRGHSVFRVDTQFIEQRPQMLAVWPPPPD